MSSSQSASAARQDEILISLIIPSFRSRATISDTLHSALEQRINVPLEVLVVDSSDDGTADWVRQRFPQVRVHHSPQRLLPGAARNRGAQLSRGEFLAFLDSDVTAPRQWLVRLLEQLKRHPECHLASAAVGCANPNSPAGRVLYWIEFSEFLPGCRSGERMALSSSNLLIRKQDFERCGGFDEEFAMAEDLIFCRRVGGTLHLEAGLAVSHRQREDRGEVLQHLRRLGFWSGRYRATFQVAGSGLKSFPLLSFALLPIRLWRILRRVRDAGPASPKIRPTDLPLLIRGLAIWCSGFFRGLRRGALRREEGSQQEGAKPHAKISQEKNFT